MVQRRNGKYRVQGWVMEGGVRVKRSFTFDRKADAQAKEDEIRQVRQLMKAGLELPADDILVFDYAQKWMVKRVRIHPKSTTEMDGSRLKNYALPVIGGYPLKMVTTKMIRELLDNAQTEKSLSNATRNRIRAVLHTMFEEAFMEEKILANPVSRVPLLKENPKRKSAIKLDDAKDLIGECYQMEKDLGLQSFGLCAIVFIWQGPRISNVVALQNRDFDLVRDELRLDRLFEQESGSVRDGVKGHEEGLVLPLFPLVRAAFIDHLERTSWKRPTDYCFRNRKGLPMTTYRAREYIKRAAKRIGLDVTPHVLRSSFASLAEEAGYSKEDIQRMMGHTSSQVTQRYIRRTAQPLKEKGEKLGFGAIEGVIQLPIQGATGVTEGQEKPKKALNSPSGKTALNRRKER